MLDSKTATAAYTHLLPRPPKGGSRSYAPVSLFVLHPTECENMNCDFSSLVQKCISAGPCFGEGRGGLGPPKVWNLSSPNPCSKSGCWSCQLLDSGRFKRSKTSHLPNCGRSCQTVGSGLWRAKSFFSNGPKQPFKPLKPPETCPQTPRTLPMVLPYWQLEQPASGF